ncbi:MAG: hypothetical protein HYU69_16810 [Bacteroidetes bacterium]|nr:hypothetical protein [Bacteroidota bacterium]
MIILISCAYCAAQDIPIGQWRMHLSYKEGIAITQGNGKIYCAAKGGLYAYNQSDNSLELMSKLTGISDVSITAINFDVLTNTLVVAYKNANIDLIQNGVITNLPDIKIKSIQGNKSINNIFFKNGFAYLACGFGIVVVDLNNHETKETYYIGPSGSAINVRDVNSDGTQLFAATDKGIYTAPLNSFNLADYNSWTKQPGLPDSTYNTLAYFNGYMYANLSKWLSGGWMQDRIYKYNGGVWTATGIGYDNFKRLRSNNNKLTTVGQYVIGIYDTNETGVGANYYNYGFANAIFADALVDNNAIAWIADVRYGLVKEFPNGPGENIVPNGPRTIAVFSMASANGKIWSAPGGYFGVDGVSYFSDNSWSTIFGLQPGGNMDSLHGVMSIVPDPNNANHAFAGSILHGLLEFNNGALVKVYNPSNSSIKNQENVSGYYAVRVNGTTYDDDGNLWVSNGETNNVISVRKKDGTWQSFDFSGYVNRPDVGSIKVTQDSKQKWVVLPRINSILVYNDNNSFTTPNSSNTKIITDKTGNGALPGIKVACIAEDKDGAIWIGTDKGIAVIYSPENIFNGGTWDAQRILIEQDGHTQILLETEEVTSIAVDGANRKWIGTSKSGVFLMSEDGTKQIHHFDITNSPLLSNEVSCITINSENGEVFLGSPNGIVSYKSTATEGGDDFTDVYAYPNPVKHDYNGTIAIKGLIRNAAVKITDISGALIYETKALGGQAIWDGKNFNGERAQTGVYLVFCSNDDGTKTYVTKILFIN